MTKDGIYVIIEGEYSDWEIKCCTDSEEKAIQICAQHNEGLPYEDWHYAGPYELGEPKEDKPVAVTHKILFRKNHNSWEFGWHEIECCVDGTMSGTTVDLKNSRAEVSFSSNDTNKNRAEKIAQDALYKYLYEHEIEGMVEDEQ